MRGAYVVTIEGLSNIESIGDIHPKTLKAARAAVNKTLDRARAASSERIRSQINFSAGYIGPDSGRLSVTKRAQGLSLDGKITARTRATSLARFVTSESKAGLRLSVKTGRAVRLPRAFLIKLKSGTASLETKNNMGLAIRTGGKPVKKGYKPLLIGKNLWLLYGPSVSQVFDTVRGDITEDTADFLEREFSRLLALDDF